MEKEQQFKAEIQIVKLQGDVAVHEQKFKDYGKLISKNNHRAEKGIEKANTALKDAVKTSREEAAVASRNSYYIVGTFLAILTIIFGMLQSSDSANQTIMTEKIDRNEERIANLLKENAKLQGELNGLRNYTEQEVEDRKVYSQRNADHIHALQNKLYDDNLKLLELSNKK